MDTAETGAGTQGPRTTSWALMALLLMLAAGDLVFVLRALTPAASLAAGGVLAGGLALLAHDNRVRLKPARAGLWFAVALAVLVLGGEGRFLPASEDWAMRDAVLHDLGRGGWPVVYAMFGGLQFLRAPLGMYLLPALADHAGGAEAGQAALWLQNAVLLGAVLAAFAAAAPAKSRGWVMAAVLLAFSGWDAVGQLLIPRAPDAFPMHIERWAIELEYSSTLTGLFWAPNHTLPGLAYAAAHLSWRRGVTTAATPAAVAALSLLWSPLAVIGMAPFVALAAFGELRARRIAWGAWAGAVLAGVALLPAAVYLRLEDARVPHGWNAAWPPFARLYPLFLALEVGPLAWLALGGKAGETRRSLRPDILLALAALLLLPLYKLGVSNDLMMRAATPALGLLAAAAGLRLAQALERGTRREVALVLAVLAVGAVTPAIEIARPFTRPSRPLATKTAPEVWEASPYASHDLQGRLMPMSTYAAHVGVLQTWRPLLRQADQARPIAVPAPKPWPPGP